MEFWLVALGIAVLILIVVGAVAVTAFEKEGSSDYDGRGGF